MLNFYNCEPQPAYLCEIHFEQQHNNNKQKHIDKKITSHLKNKKIVIQGGRYEKKRVF